VEFPSLARFQKDRSPSFSTTTLKTKDLLKTFGSGKKYADVAPHAPSPPSFPHTDLARPIAPFKIAPCEYTALTAGCEPLAEPDYYVISPL
jgi:hypothetical protein